MIEIDPTSPTPIYRQIAEQFRRLIALGALVAGDRLPTVRELAVQVRVNRNTAARAIRELESGGVVRTQVGQGTFVEAGPAKIDIHRRASIVDGLIDRLVVEAHTLGMPLERLGPRLGERIESFKTRRQGDEEQGE